jgi:pimeloyl-ACP methyl ester carboxylesterase
MCIFIGSIMSDRAARRVHVVAWVVVAVAALPCRVIGQCTPLTCDTAVNGSIETASEVDCFTFTAGDAEIVDISVVSLAAGSSFQPEWRLLDGSGSPVGGDCGEFGRSEPNFPCALLPASGGPYRLEVEAAQPGDTGAYAVRFESVTADRACEDVPLTCAVPVYGTIDDPLDTDLFSFSVDDGEWIEISVVSGLHGGTVIDAAWRLVDASGVPVDGPCGVFSKLGIDYACGPLPATGNPYRVVVGDDDAKDAGQYKVRFQPLTSGAACSSTPLPCGVARTAAIDDPPPEEMCGFSACPVLDTELFSFTVNDGEHIAVTVENTSPSGDGFLAGWRILDHTGSPVEGTCGDFNASPANFECGPLPATGNPYRIEVGDVDQFVAGHAHVSVNFLTSTCATECPGDCDGSQAVAINELLMLVNIALGNASAPACIPGDANRDGMVGVDELITAVNKALNGCGDGTPPFIATFEPATCEMPLPEGQDPTNVRCGWLTVPENRRHPEGRTIKLAVVILKATGTNPEPDPLVILSGGPGQWAIDSVLPRFSSDFAAPIQSKRDIVVFDQRGSGRSQPALNCSEVSSYKDSLAVLTTTEEDVEIDTQIFIACRDRLVREGNDLSGYSSAATARDIDDLMTTLGYDRFNLYGLSYGTRVALTALRDQPGSRIRSAVLDSVVPPQVDGVRTGSALEGSFDRLLADCAADADCNRVYPNLRQETFDLIDQFTREPLMLSPIDPATGEPFPVIITGDRLIRLAESAFQSAALIPFLPTFVVTTAGGTTALLTAALGAVAAPALYSAGVQNAVLCNEEVPLIDPVRVEQERALVNPTLAHAFAYPDAYMRACPHFELPAPDPIEGEPVHSDVPTLIFAGQYDPNTPAAFGRLAAETLPNSSYFEFRGFGHVVLFQQAAPTGPPACAMQVMAAFLDDPQHAPDGSCVAAIPPPHFVGS